MRTSTVTCVRLLGASCIALFLMIATACGGGLPSVAAAEKALRSKLDNGSETRMRVVSFQKTDGRTGARFHGRKSLHADVYRRDRIRHERHV